MLKEMIQFMEDLRGPIIFRPHRGGLAEAMAEAKEFKNIRAMKKFIVKDWNEGWIDMGEEKLFDVSDVVVDKASAVNDERIKWQDSMHVCIKRLGKDIYKTPQCIGMCATVYPQKK